MTAGRLMWMGAMNMHDDDDDYDYDDYDDYDFDDSDGDDDGLGNEALVLDCGVKGCLMPGYHLRSECHTLADVEAFEQEMLTEYPDDPAVNAPTAPAPHGAAPEGKA